MGELFKREVPAHALRFTGERFTSASVGQTAIEHLHRALIARSLCDGKDVLDIASGEGYCSALLAQVATSVVGVDISLEAIAHARNEYRADNLTFREGSALDIPLEDHSVDVVVSFETIEHFRGHKRFVSEIKRVLRPGGLVIISTPDQAVYSPEDEPANPYHAQEMTRDEFRSLIGLFFQHNVLLGQRTMIGSAMIAETHVGERNSSQPFFTYEQRPPHAFERSGGLARAKYLVAIASDNPQNLEGIEDSVFIATSEIDRALNACTDVRQELAQTKAALQESLGSEARWRSDIETVTGWFETSKASVAKLQDQLDEANRTLARVSADAAELEGREEQLRGELAASQLKLRDTVLALTEATNSLSDEQRAASHMREEREGLQRSVDRLHKLISERDVEVALHRAMTSGENASIAFEVPMKAARAAAASDNSAAAESNYRLAIAAQPNSSEAWKQYGSCLAERGTLEAALGAWRRAVELNPWDPEALQGLGFTLKRLGFEPEALTAFKAAFSIDPTNQYVRGRLEESGLATSEIVDLVLGATKIHNRPTTQHSSLWGKTLKSYRARKAERHGWVRRAGKTYIELAARAHVPAEILQFGDAIARTLGLRAAEASYLRACIVAPDDGRARRRANDLQHGTFGFNLLPRVGLVRERDGCFITESDDPQFVLDPDGRRMPSGWVLFVISASAPERALRPILYVSHGASGEKVSAFTLPIVEGNCEVRTLVPLPDDVKGIRLDPVAESGVRFRLERVGWLSGVALEGAIFTPISHALAFVGENPPMSAPPVLEGGRQELKLVGTKDLEDLGEGWFRSTGGDPQFSLQGVSDLPCGWTWIEIEIEELTCPLDAIIYVWTEGSVLQIGLPRFETPGVFRALLRLPERVSALRFDPTFLSDIRFKPGAIRFRTVTGTLPQLFKEHRGTVGVQGRFTVEPGIDLQEVGEDLYVTRGNDPQFDLLPSSTAFPSGFVKLSIEIERADAALDPVMYVWGSTGDLPCFEYRFDNVEPSRCYDFFIVLPDDVSAIRFDPCTRAGTTLSRPHLTILPVGNEETDSFVIADEKGALLPIGVDMVCAHLTPTHHLSEQNGRFVSTGDDPQFAVSLGELQLPSGWTVVTVDLDIIDKIARPILYVWSNEEVYPIVLAPMAGTSRWSQLVRLPDTVTSIRFDPVDFTGADFVVGGISFARPSAFAGHMLRRQSGGDRAVEYSLWCSRHDTLSDFDRGLIVASVERLACRPVISVLMPVYNPEPRFLRRALDTVVDQLYPNWELCIAEDCSPNPEIRAILAEYAARDPRIKVVYREANGHISRASNSALELVTGSFVALMDHDDELPAHALYMIARELNLHPETDVIYSDEDKIDASGRRHDPHFKTDWNEELFYSQNMVAHLGAFRATLVRAVGGFRAGFEGSQDYDFMLRILKVTAAERIRHIPFVLYHWRIFEGVRTFSSNNPSRSVETAGQAMEEYFKEVEPHSQVLPIESFPGWWRIKRPLPTVAPSVTIVIPTRDRVSLVRNCVEGILTRTDYPDLDVIIIDNGSVEADSLSYFAEVSKDTRVQVLRDDGPFNYSRLNNEAVARARGDYVCFLNNDIEVIAPDWLSEMMSHAVRERVGAVGARLLYAGGTLQHAGVTLGVYGVAAHGHRHFAGDSIGYFGHPQLVREVSAVTGAALLMRRPLFESLGGFDALNLAVSYNDVDLCLRVGEAGYKVIYTPFAALYHLESATRGPDVSPAQKELQRVERGYMQARWGHVLPQDPFYNPNLSLVDEDYRLAFPPRVAKPWLDEADVAERLARKGQMELAVEAANVAGLALLAADTAAVIASAHPFGMLEELSRSLTEAGFSFASVTIVDNTPRSDGFVREGALARFKAAHPGIPVILVDDASQDFNASRTANLGVRASGAARHLLVVTEDCSFVTGWLRSLLSSWQAAGGGDVVITPRIFVRENTARDGVLTDGFVEMPLAQVVADPTAIMPMGRSYDDLPLAGRIPPSEAEMRPALEETTLLGGGVVFGRRTLLVDETGDRADGFEANGAAVFDTLFLTQAARLEDMALRLLEAGARLYTATAPLAVLSGPRSHDMEHLWQYWHDYLWLNRKVHGLPDDGRVEFVCPFHRGDVLLGLQVAYTAAKAGKMIRFHVAESLLSWVRDFSPPFPVEGLPVPVPPAQETALYLLRSYEHVLRRGDAGPRLARSHPFRGLDAMDNNLATAMLAAVGLPPETLIESLVPEPDLSQQREAAVQLAPYGERVVLLHRSGGWELKTIPDTVLEELAAAIKAEGFHLVQIGGPGDIPCREADGLIAGNLSAAHWIALFQQAKAIVGVDSWSAHMAAILDVPQVTLYGSTHPRHVASKPYFRKRNAEALILGPVVPCSPCNSLTCLIEPIPYCKGYSIDQTKLKKFLEKL